MGMWDMPAKHYITDTELRFNPYHDPQNGRFTTANGGGSGGGFLYSKGGKSAYVFDAANKEKSTDVEKVMINGVEKEVYSTAPEGFKIDTGATGAPYGMNIYTNGKSRFGGERKTVYVKDDFHKNESAQSLIEKSRESNRRKSENNKNALMNRYDRPQQSSASSRRQTRRLHNQLSGWL